MTINLKTKEEIERFILIVNIGIMTGIRDGVISIEEAEKYLYSPYSVQKIEALGINENVVNLMKLGCELEDIESLIPDKLSDAVDELSNKSIELLSLIPKSAPIPSKWIE